MLVAGTVVPVFVVVSKGLRQAPLKLMQLPAGALSATSGPRLENPTLVPMWRTPATAMTPLQLAGVSTARPSALPAEMTTVTPAAVNCEIASV